MRDRPPFSVWIESTRGPDDEPVCQLTYTAGPDRHRSHPSVADVRATAADLVITAADAEACVLLAGLGLDAGTITAFAEDLLRRRGRKSYGARSTVLLGPAASTKTGRAWVRIRPSAGDGMLTPDEARQMARDWFEVAAGTEADQMLAEALRACTAVTPDEEETLYAYMGALRAKRA
jgi:hypothetical protein